MPRPEFGVLAFIHPESKTRPFGEQTGFIKQLLLVAERCGLSACAFGPQQVDARGRVLRPYRWRDGAWRSGVATRPHLVYDRFFLHRPQPQTLRRYRSLLRRRPWPFLNPTLPDKWTVHRVLAGHAGAAAWLPPTARYLGPKQVADRLRRERALVVKPVRGMKGRGLYFLERRGNDVFIDNGRGTRVIIARGRLAAWCRARLSRESILQPCLALVDRQGRPFDIRALVQRDGSGRLSVTGAAVRLGRPGRRVANLHQGGRALSLVQAAEQVDGLAAALPGDAAPALAALVEQASLVIVQALDRRFGPLAEVALDFGFDLQRARLFLLEANSRPGRAVFRQSGDHATRTRSIERPIAYACYRLRQRGLLPADAPPVVASPHSG